MEEALKSWLTVRLEQDGSYTASAFLSRRFQGESPEDSVTIASSVSVQVPEEIREALAKLFIEATPELKRKLEADTPGQIAAGLARIGRGRRGE